MTGTYVDYIMFAIVALMIFIVYMGAVAVLRKDPVRERLKRFVPVNAIESGFIYEESRSSLASFCEHMLRALGTDVTKAKRELYFVMARAGLMSTDAVVYYLFFKRFMQPLIAILGALIIFLGLSQPMLIGSMRLLYAINGVFLLVIGFWGAKLYIVNRTNKRHKAITRSFADALDLLLVCVESGLPLDGALARVCKEMKVTSPEITEELDRFRIELSVLNDRVQAMQNLAERTNTPGFRSLVPALVQTEKFGTSISETLRVLSDEYRTSRMLQAETRAARIPVLVTIPLVCLILPPVFILIMAPPIIKINQQGGLFGKASVPASSSTLRRRN